MRPGEGQPLEAEGDVAAVLEPEEAHGEGGEEPGGRDVGAVGWERGKVGGWVRSMDGWMDARIGLG